ncbi:MAG: VanZ family protein [Nitrospira sp.]
MTLLGLYLVYVVIFGLAPFTWSLPHAASITELFVDHFEGWSGFSNVTSWDVWSNVVFFIPCGGLMVLLPGMSRRPWFIRLLLAFIGAAALSSGVELAQLLFTRAPSFVDIVCNTVGGMAGGVLGVLANMAYHASGEVWAKTCYATAWLGWIVAGYVLLLAFFTAWPFPLASDFSNWNPTYRLLLGNEGTMNRPWLGTLHLVAVYDRALPSDEITTHFSLGPLVDSQERRTKQGLVLYYDFSEQAGAIVHDRAAKGPSTDLYIQDLSRTAWVFPNGLTLSADTVIASRLAPDQVVGGGLLADKELSVEAWVTPADLAQTGPARIVSFSKNTDVRNFTLGQQSKDVVFRLRTPISGYNGANPALSTSDAPLTRATQHIVATYREGMERLYVDGIARAQVSLDRRGSLRGILTWYTGESLEWSLYSAMVFPLGLLSSLYYQIKSVASARLCAVSSALGALVVLEVLYLLTMSAPLSLFLLMVGAGTVLVSVFWASLFFDRL